MTAAASPGTGDMERQALAALRKMRERVDALESARHEPLAIVGAACRFPGAPDPEAFLAFDPFSPRKSEITATIARWGVTRLRNSRAWFS